MPDRGGHSGGPIDPAALLALLRRDRPADYTGFLAWTFAGQRIGWIRPALAERLGRHPDLFALTSASVNLRGEAWSVAERSDAVNALIRAELAGLPGFGRWNDEYGDVTGHRGILALRIARCAVVPFGVRSQGAHINGVDRSGDGPRLWVARRNPSDPDFGGYLDTLAGGFIPSGAGVVEVAHREAQEEAGVAPQVCARIRPCAALRGVCEFAHGIAPYGIYCFDLDLAPGETPRPADEEIADFSLMEVDAVIGALTAGRFKFNTIPVIADWLIRQGFLAPDSRDYWTLCDLLRQWDPDI